MTSTYQTYRGVFDVLVTKIQQDILAAQTNGTTQLSEEDLKTIFTLVTAHAQTTSVNGWESLQNTIVAESGKTKKSRKK